MLIKAHSNTKAEIAALLLLTLFLVAVGGAQLSSGVYFFDNLPNAGIASSYRLSDEVLVHKKVYKDSRLVMSESDYELVTDGYCRNCPSSGFGKDPNYRSSLKENPDLFQKQFVLYEQRFLFPALIYALSGVTGNEVFSARILNVLFFLLIGVATYFLCRIELRPVTSLIFAVLLMATPPMFQVGLLGTADGLAAGLFLLGLISLRWKKLWLSRILLTLVFFCRPEYLVLAIVIELYLWRIEGGRTSVLLAATGLYITAFLATILSLPHPGWQVLFYIHFIERLADFDALPSSLPLAEYLRVYFSWFVRVEARPLYLLTLLLGVATVVLQAARPRHRNWCFWPTIASIVFWILSVLLWPDPQYRYVLGVMILVWVNALTILYMTTINVFPFRSQSNSER